MPAWLRDALAVSTACGAATAPILWLQFGSVPVYSLLANALVALAIGPLLGLALVGALARAAAAVGGACPRLGERLARRLHRRRAPALVARLPFAQIGSGEAVCVLLGAPVALLALQRLPRWRRPAAVGVRCDRRPRPARLAALSRPTPLPPPEGPSRHVPRRRPGRRDPRAGGRGRRSSSTRARPRRTSRSSYARSASGGWPRVVLTHPQRDHIGGAEAVLRRLAVDRVLDPRLTRSSALRARGARRGRASTASRSSRRGRATLPARPAASAGALAGSARAPRARTRTSCAVVLLATYGEVDVLLTADAETDVTAAAAVAAGRDPQGRAPRLRRRRSRERAARAAAGGRGDLVRPRQRLRTSAPVDARGAACAARGSASTGPTRTGAWWSSPTASGSGPDGALSRVEAVAAAPDLKPVYLLTGSDRPKIATALARLRRHFEPEAVELVTAQEATGEDAAALCNAGSLFGDARLVVVEGVDGRRNAEGRLVERLEGRRREGDRGVPRARRRPAPCSRSSAEELKKDAPLRRRVAKTGDVLAFDVREAERRQLGRRALQAGGRAGRAGRVRGSRPSRRRGPPRSSRTRSTSSPLWAGGEPIGEREVELLVAAVAETPTFALTDAWAQRDIGAALGASETILEREGRPRRDTAAPPRRRAGQPVGLRAPLPAARGRGRPAARGGGRR